MAASIEQVNMTEGALLPKVLRFSLPLAATGVLQLLFNAADVIVVGKFAGATALAAVGATTALINLLVNAFMGISVGVNILVARYLGCREDERVRACVHTAFALSLLLGLVVMAAGLTLSTPMLEPWHGAFSTAGSPIFSTIRAAISSTVISLLCTAIYSDVGSPAAFSIFFV